jgi:hypothetical protein
MSTRDKIISDSFFHATTTNETQPQQQQYQRQRQMQRPFLVFVGTTKNRHIFQELISIIDNNDYHGAASISRHLLCGFHSQNASLTNPDHYPVQSALNSLKSWCPHYRNLESPRIFIGGLCDVASESVIAGINNEPFGVIRSYSAQCSLMSAIFSQGQRVKEETYWFGKVTAQFDINHSRKYLLAVNRLKNILLAIYRDEGMQHFLHWSSQLKTSVEDSSAAKASLASSRP